MMSGSTIGTGSLTCLRMSKDSGDAEGDWERLIFLRIQDIQFCCMESTISHC